MQTKTKTILISFLIWTGLGLFWTSRLYTSYNSTESVIPFVYTLYWGLSEFYIWGLLSIFIIPMAKFFPLSRERWVRSLLFLIPISTIIVAIQLGLFTYAVVLENGLKYLYYSYENPDYWLIYKNTLLGKFHSSFLVFWGMIAVTNLVLSYRRLAEETIRAKEIEARLAQAELQALQMQLHPHFLFNALNTISALMHENVERADAMLVKLSGLLRTVLRQSAELETPLSEELDFIRKYLEIEKARFGNRLQILFEIDDETQNAMAPAFILQPLIENAIKHGISGLEEGGKIIIQSKRENDSLVLTVQNDKCTEPIDRQESAEGIGLNNTRERLGQLYGKNSGFDFDESANMFKVIIRIPFRERVGALTR